MSEGPRAVSGARKEASRRLFFALWPPASWQVSIEQALSTRVSASGGRPIPTRNLHVTLEFLGSVPESRLAAAISCANAAQACPPFDVCFDKVEIWARSRVLCLTASEMPEPLTHLAQRLRSNLLDAGFDLGQEQEYRPHVTLARDVRRRGRAERIDPVEWQVEAFVLVLSQPGPSGSAYQVLEQWPLAQD